MALKAVDFITVNDDNKGLESDPSKSPPAQQHFATVLDLTEFKNLSYFNGLAIMLIGHFNQKV